MSIGPSRLTVSQKDMIRAGMLRSERSRWMEQARVAAGAAGDIQHNKCVAARYVRMARYAQSAYLLMLSAPQVQS